MIRMDHAGSYKNLENERHTSKEAENVPMPKTPAERQAEFKQAMKEAGFVRLEAYVTKEQREKFRQLGGDAWLREKINRAKEPGRSGTGGERSP